MKRFFCKHKPQTTQDVGVSFLVQTGQTSVGDLSVAKIKFGVQAVFTRASMVTCADCNRVLSEPTRSQIGVGFMVFELPMAKLPLVVEEGKIDVSRAAARWLRYWVERGHLGIDVMSESFVQAVESVGGTVETLAWDDVLKTYRSQEITLPESFEIKRPAELKFVNAE